MRTIFYIAGAILWLFPNTIQSQIEQYNYVGVQTYEGGDFTAYHLDFEFFNNTIQGRAIVDYGGPDETLYYIKGTYNTQKSVLQFKASYLVWTKSDIPQKDHCILHFAATVKNLKRVKAFSGPYRSRTKTGENCAKGLLIFSRIFKETAAVVVEKEIIKETNKDDPSITENKPAPIPVSKARLESTPIKKDENLNIFVKKSTVTLRIYDAGKADDDRIAITINGKAVLDNYTITRKKKKLEVTLEAGQSIIEVTALNEGTKPPNTVKVEVIDGHKMISTRTSLKTGEKASITLLH